MEADDRVITPLSATPQSDVNVQAAQMFNSNFSRRLNQFEGLQRGPLRHLVDQALDDSFKELLSAYTLSPNASPGAGPSIIVSPVSRSPSDTTRPLSNDNVDQTRPPADLERKHSVTNIVSQPRHVPLLQQPRPPRPKVDTALRVPTDHHRSPAGGGWRESQSVGIPAECLQSFQPLQHVQDDPGYGDDCNSYEQGDDQPFFGDPIPFSVRKINNSVVSNDSGYGSMKHRHKGDPQIPASTSALQGVWNGVNERHTQSEPNYSKGHDAQVQVPHSMTGASSDNTGFSQGRQVGHDNVGFESYSDFLSPSFQDEIWNGTDYPFFDPHTA